MLLRSCMCGAQLLVCCSHCEVECFFLLLFGWIFYFCFFLLDYRVSLVYCDRCLRCLGLLTTA
jgi:hypothetical protein